MPGISIISNFDINQSVPLDSRQVATSSASRDATPYKYEGLKIYQTDTKKTYIWTGVTFSIDGSGIYGGSGSLIGDTLVNFGQVGNTVSNKSSQFGYSSTSATNGIFYTNYFNRHTAAIPGTEWQGIELRNEFRYSTSGGVVNSAYVSFNPADTTNGYGGIAFGTGDGMGNTVQERVRITGNGRVGIGTNDPKEYLQIGSGTVGSGQSLPLTIHKGGSAVIGYNWYYNSADFVFDLKDGSSKISHEDGNIRFTHRKSLDSPATFVDSLYLSSTGNVGIKTTSPQYDLDVNGNLRSNNVKINSSLTASNIFATSNYFLPNSNYKLTSVPLKPIVFVNNSNSSQLFYISDQDSGFYTDLDVDGTVNVSDNVTIQEGSLTVGGGNSIYQGAITNYEDPTILSPSGTLIYYSTNGAWNVTSNSHPLSGFTYSFNFYRVGALVNLDFTIKRLNTTAYNHQFYGWLIKFDNSRFKPTSFNKGSGIGGVSGNALRSPVWCQVVPGGTPGHPSTGGNNPFWFKIGTFNTLSNSNGVPTYNQGGDFTGASVTDLYFSGTITYISSSNPASVGVIDTFDDQGSSTN
jgi:hypothetical protein